MGYRAKRIAECLHDGHLLIVLSNALRISAVPLSDEQQTCASSARSRPQNVKCRNCGMHQAASVSSGGGNKRHEPWQGVRVHDEPQVQDVERRSACIGLSCAQWCDGTAECRSCACPSAMVGQCDGRAVVHVGKWRIRQLRAGTSATVHAARCVACPRSCVHEWARSDPQPC